MAAAPPSSSRRMPSRSCDSGPRRGHHRMRQRQAEIRRRQVRHRLPQERQLFVLLPLAIDRLLRRAQQRLAARRDRSAAACGSAAPLGVGAERHRRPHRVERERPLAHRAQLGVVADQRPVAAVHGAALLIEARAACRCRARCSASRRARATAPRRPRLRAARRASAAGWRPWRCAPRRRCRRPSPAAPGPSSRSACRRWRTSPRRRAAWTSRPGRRCWSRPRCRAPAR